MLTTAPSCWQYNDIFCSVQTCPEVLENNCKLGPTVEMSVQYSAKRSAEEEMCVDQAPGEEKLQRKDSHMEDSRRNDKENCNIAPEDQERMKKLVLESETLVDSIPALEARASDISELRTKGGERTERSFLEASAGAFDTSGFVDSSVQAESHQADASSNVKKIGSRDPPVADENQLRGPEREVNHMQKSAAGNSSESEICRDIQVSLSGAEQRTTRDGDRSGSTSTGEIKDKPGILVENQDSRETDLGIEGRSSLRKPAESVKMDQTLLSGCSSVACTASRQATISGVGQGQACCAAPPNSDEGAGLWICEMVIEDTCPSCGTVLNDQDIRRQVKRDNVTFADMNFCRDELLPFK